MDAAPNGAQIIGGAAPGAVALSKDGRLAYVALSNVDRVAVVSLAGAPRVVRGLDLRLYPGAPYGAAPSAEALSPDGKRLYVALAGLNAVAVLDARRTTRYRFGLIPTAWYPTAIALSPNGRYLYVANAKGAAGQASLQRVDLKRTSLVKATLATLRYNRTPGLAKFNPVIPPLRSNRRSEVIDHVVYIAVGTRGYDAMLGDLKDDSGKPHGNGDPALTVYPQSLTPNLHTLARTYALADNFYAADADLNVAKQFATASGATLYQQLVDAAGAARAPMNDHGDDPEDYARGGISFQCICAGPPDVPRLWRPLASFRIRWIPLSPRCSRARGVGGQRGSRLCGLQPESRRHGSEPTSSFATCSSSLRAIGCRVLATS